MAGLRLAPCAMMLAWPMATASPVLGQASHSDRPSLRAAAPASSIKIDGRLDERAWLVADSSDAFTQTDPEEGRPATERTVVRVLLDNDALYVGVRLLDRAAAMLRPKVARRDTPAGTDEFVMLLDPFHDHLSAFRLSIALGGARGDATVSSNQFAIPDPSWEPVWQSATTRDESGWTAEIRVPLSQLRFSQGGDGAWGIQFERIIFRKHERDVFAFTPKRETGGVADYGHLTGMSGAGGGHHLELLPYASMQAEYLPGELQTPLQRGAEYHPNAGFDLKASLSQGLTLSATVNPDFGQVELDPAIVNLSAFETFLPERRPFFVESANRFQFGRIRAWNSLPFPQVFFSRRIGRAPQLSGSQGDFQDTPRQTTILGAAKVTGRTRKGWTVGLLDAVTPAEYTHFLGQGGDVASEIAEPRTNYAVARLSRELNRGSTTIGLIGTAVNRHLPDARAQAVLRSGAYVGGFDLGHAWGQRSWALDLNVLASHVEGSAAAIGLTQRASARYYQRPDATSFRYDPARTSLSGAAMQASISRLSGEHWVGSLAYQGTTPGFEVGDLGFESAVGQHAVSADVHWQENRPGRLFRSYILWPFTNHVWNSDGNLVANKLNLWFQGELRNYWTGWLWLYAQVGGYDDKLTRGGPLARRPRQVDFSGMVATDSRRSVGAQVQGTLSRAEAGYHAEVLSVTMTARQGANLRFEFGPSYAGVHDPAQYVQTVTDPLATSTYGRRYVFADLRQTTIALNTRVDWTFTPAISLQLYLQPLIGRGRYTSYREFSAPRRYDFLVYGRDRGTVGAQVDGQTTIDPDGSGPAAPFQVSDPSFLLRSLRGNLVLRWEYGPGATVYLVWQQERDGTDSSGNLDLGRDLLTLFRTPPRNTLALKATYWINP